MVKASEASITQPLSPAGQALQCDCMAAGQKRSSFLSMICGRGLPPSATTSPACITHLVLHCCSNRSCILGHTFTIAVICQRPSQPLKPCSDNPDSSEW